MRFTASNPMKPTQTMQSSAPFRATRVMAVAGMATLVVLAVAPAGCYRNVVGTTGTGADHVRNVYGDHYFTGGGAGYPDYLADGELLRERGRGYARLIAGATTPGRVLDIGAAAGFVLQGLCDEGWRGAGIEPNAAFWEKARG